MSVFLKNDYMIGNMLKYYKSLQNNKEGYTLVEMLVATALFVTVVVILIDIIILFVRDNDNDVDQRQLENDVAFVMEEAQRNFRQVFINYDHPSFSASNPVDILYMVDSNGIEGMIGLGSHPDIAPYGTDPERLYVVTLDGSPTQASPLTDATTHINRLEFFIYPNANPYELLPGVPATNYQQTIGMYIEAEDIDNTEVSVTAQTLITSRYYGR